MIYDLAIIGAGPSGLMAAYRAGELGLRVVLVEKNLKPALKLLLSGGGRCNITNDISDPKILAAKYLPNGRFLISAFSLFGPDQVRHFFEGRGVPLKEEDNGRIFPSSDRAKDVLEALIRSISKEVELLYGKSVISLNGSKGMIDGLELDDGTEISARNYLVATGGMSYPQTGSSGDAYNWLKFLGHHIVSPRPVLVPIRLVDAVSELEGLSLYGAVLSLYESEKKIAETRGDMMFTKDGLSGPATLDLSRFIQDKKYSLHLDLIPGKGKEELEGELQNLFHSGKRSLKNILSAWIPARLKPFILSRARIDLDREANSITKAERTELVTVLKGLDFRVAALKGFDQAMVTAGGVYLKEVDPSTMHSKIVRNLYLAGEILDLTGPTGGYNLQLCWSTAYAAATAVGRKKRK